MRILVRHVQVTGTALRDIALIVGDMQREAQYLSYNLFNFHCTDSPSLIDIRENMTVCVTRGKGNSRPPNSGPAGHRQQRYLLAPW